MQRYSETHPKADTLKTPRRDDTKMPSGEVLRYVKALLNRDQPELIGKLLAESEKVRSDVAKWLAIAIIIKGKEFGDTENASSPNESRAVKLSPDIRRFIYHRLTELRNQRRYNSRDDRSKIVIEEVRDRFRIAPTRQQIAAFEAHITMRRHAGLSTEK
jgi:hypothetical protein